MSTGSFAALMALSHTQTKESQSAVQMALQQRARRDEQKRKQQEEQARKERELERQIRLKHFEDERRERESQQRREEERQSREADLQRREEAQRDALRYGPKKAKSMSGEAKWPASSSQTQTRDDVRRRRLPDDDDDDNVGGEGLQLTREEKRRRKVEAEMRRVYSPAKRTAHTGGYHKSGRRLPGGAVDVTSSTPFAESTAPSSSGSRLSVRERLAAMPNTLTRLNVVKRDTRTIDEIVQDRAKARQVSVLGGEQALGFSDWFPSKKKDTPKNPLPSAAAPARASASASPSPGGHTPASRTYLWFAPTPVCLS